MMALIVSNLPALQVALPIIAAPFCLILGRGAWAWALATWRNDTVALCIWVWETIAQLLSVVFDNPLIGAVCFLGGWFEGDGEDGGRGRRVKGGG